MSADTPRSDRPSSTGDKYLDAVHEVSEQERGARRPAAEDESADPVGDGRSDADLAEHLPTLDVTKDRDRPGRETPR